MRPTTFWDCTGLLCLSYFQSDGRLILTQSVTLLFLSLSNFFYNHHRALSEKEMKSVSPEKSLHERLLHFLSNVLIPNLISILCSMKSMVYISSTTATISMLIPQDIVDGRPIPGQNLPNSSFLEKNLLHSMRMKHFSKFDCFWNSSSNPFPLGRSLTWTKKKGGTQV